MTKEHVPRSKLQRSFSWATASVIVLACSSLVGCSGHEHGPRTGSSASTAAAEDVSVELNSLVGLSVSEAKRRLGYVNGSHPVQFPDAPKLLEIPSKNGGKPVDLSGTPDGDLVVTATTGTLSTPKIYLGVAKSSEVPARDSKGSLPASFKAECDRALIAAAYGNTPPNDLLVSVFVPKESAK